MLSYLVKKIFNNKVELLGHALATSAAVISRLSMLLITLINTQFLLPSEFGIFAVLILLANMINAFVSCGGDMWLNRFSRHRHAHFAQAPIVARFYMQISAVLAGLVVLIALGFAIFARESFGGHGLAITFLLLWTAAAGMIETILAILRTTNDIHRFFIIRDLLMPITLISSIIVLKIDTCLEFFFIAFLLWVGVLIFLLNFILRRGHLYLPKSHWTWTFLGKGLIGYTMGLILNNFSARLANGFDTLILARLLPMDWVGKYRFVAHFSNAFAVVQHFVFLALPWHLRRGVGCSKDIQRLETIKLRQTYLVISALPALLIFTLLAKPLLGLLRQDFQVMAPFFVIFLLIRFGELLWGPQHEALISNNKVVQDTVANVLGIVSGVSLFLISLNFFSLMVSGVIASGVSSLTIQSTRYIFLNNQRQNLAKNTQNIPWISIAITFLSLGYVIQSELIK